MITLRKQPYVKLAYDFDFDHDGGIPAGESIALIESIAATSCNVVSGSAALSVSNQTSSGRTAQAMLEGGTHGETYKVTAKVIDTVGQKHELDGLLEVVDE